MKAALIWVVAVGLLATEAVGQSFGRNKPRYKHFDFEVLETPNFSIHHYLKNDSALVEFASWAEHWYRLHQTIFRDTFQSRNPILLYANHPDFQQTAAIQGMIGIGTGGVTEGLRNRVVMPWAFSNQHTNHVLGHELVHAFQYYKLIHGDTTLKLQNIQNIPLWMIEGLAEYLSLGRVDPHTAMWMRDAVQSGKLPTIKDLNDPRFFPYRYGQAFWAFVGGTFGDTIIEPLFVATAKNGLEAALDSVLHLGQKNFSNMWQNGLKNWYQPLMEGLERRPPGRKILDDKNAGEMNLAPTLSPDGRYLVFLSERDLFTIDLYLADARTGKILRKVSSTVRDGHLDAYSYIESSGAWSPDSKQFAFVAFSKGRNVLVFYDPFKGKNLREVAVPGVPAFNTIAWSPDGREIVLSGLVDGQVDLFAYDLRSGRVRRLTNDRYSEVHPAFSADGQWLAFATDRLSRDGKPTFGKWHWNLALMNLQSGQVRNLDLFPGADNLNPVFDSRGDLWFLSNRDGFRNLYRWEQTSGKVYQMTRLPVGISGITAESPALSIGGKKDRLVYSYYQDGKYTIYQALPDRFEPQEVDPYDVDFQAATLPPVGTGAPDLVSHLLQSFQVLRMLPDTGLHRKDYTPRLQLEYIGGSAGVGVGTQTFGTSTAMQGGVDMLFGDLLGDHRLYTGLALNGEIQDFAGQVAYLNQKNRLGWGASLSHIPYRVGSLAFLGLDTLDLGGGFRLPTGKYALDIFRMFEERASVFAQLPFSQTRRIEGGISYTRIHYRIDRFFNYYDEFGRLVFQERTQLDAPDGVGFAAANAAFVADNSFFGITSPLQGYRYRFGVEKYFGGLDFFSIIADYRHYLRLKPLTFAVRAMHLGRYGRDAERLSPVYVGYPWFVRGYGLISADDVLEANKLSVNQLAGSKLLVGNAELRLPFTGPGRLAVIPSQVFFSELTLFFDAGMAWSSTDDIDSGQQVGIFSAEARPVFSVGTSVRVNLFGVMVLEPYWAVPLLRETRVVFGVNIVPGW